ncbi:MAG TPA: dihydroorotase, partial [Gemmataceae bacterium]|nr:dihydroorotase [Gemmataceae bacterium]
MTLLRITNGRIIDPAQNIDRTDDLWIQGDLVLGIGSRPDLTASQTLNATGKIVCPGLIDMHVHLREPGREEDETILTGTRAAIAGGITSVACMPNTEPPIDSQADAEFMRMQATRAGFANVFPIGTISKNREGKELAEIGGLVAGGAVAFTDDGSPVVSSEIMRRALEYTQMFDKAVLSHCEDLELTRGGVMHEGFESLKLGLRGMPAAAEEIMVFRDIALAEMTGGRLHILHVSTAGSVELIRSAKQRGVRVTGEACTHHCCLTDASLRTYDSNYKMSPPLRTQKDVDALLEGLRDGTLEVIATDHAPHSREKKMREFDQTPNGIIGLETLLPLTLELEHNGHVPLLGAIGALSQRPADILRLPAGRLSVGAAADLTIFDLDRPWRIDVDAFRSKSK